jgi:hypothetical protein
MPGLSGDDDEEVSFPSTNPNHFMRSISKEPSSRYVIFKGNKGGTTLRQESSFVAQPV